MLKGIMICQRCIGGQVRKNEDGELRCIQCNAPHTPSGELIRPINGKNINIREKPRHEYKGRFR